MEFERSDSPLQKWQDKVNSGFDKLVAFASEIEKRRKSTEATSPRQEGFASPRCGERRSQPLSETPISLERETNFRSVQEEEGMRGSDPTGPPYSPHSPTRLSPSPLPLGRPPTPQSPRPPVRTPPISSPPPTPSPDGCDGGSPGSFPPRGGETPPYLPPELETTRLVSSVPSSQHGIYHHHFKKKFYHKERMSPIDVDHLNNHNHTHHGKFRPKGKDWQWRNQSSHHHRKSPPSSHQLAPYNSSAHHHHNHHRHGSAYQSSVPRQHHNQMVSTVPPQRSQGQPPQGSYYHH